MVSLTNWYFTKIKHFHLKGVVSGHPKLSDGMDITTSQVNTVTRQGNNLMAKTRSGTLYCLELAEMNMDDYVIKDTEAALGSFGFDVSFIQEAGVLSGKKRVECLNAADRLIQNDELLLIMSGTNTTKAYFKSNNRVEMCSVDIHSGMVQDSILVSLFGKVDFRYFPHAFSCEVYHWSDGLLGVKIKNTGDRDVVFGRDGRMLHVRKGEIKSLNKDIFANEGLFSPDCVTGMSVLSK